MHCLICRRPLIRQAVPGLCIGPKCAKDRGLMPEPIRRTRLFDTRATQPNTAQIDWVNLINAGGFAGESHA
jgi:hypothetical protein